jgi:HlyD family secretion protein
MQRNYFNWIVLMAGLCILLVVIFMWNEKASRTTAPPKPISMHPVSPFKSYISAVGIVEAKSDNIFIGSPVNRVVDKVIVKVGDKVKEGDVLFRLESHDLQADLETRSIGYENAIANLKKLEALPRAEDVVSAAAKLKSVQIELDQSKALYDRVAGLQDSGAMSHEEVNRRRYGIEFAEAKLQQAQAEFDKINAGAWLPDLEIARLQVKQAEANLQLAKANIQRTIIQSPIDATVLQIKIHEGELPPSDPLRTPPMIIGNINELHLRVSINQFDASYYLPSGPAVAFLQGNAKVEFPLHFVKVEPYFVTKQNLTNEITEKVDTRVLQVIYSLQMQEQGVYVGQQMDVFIETPQLE